jgi:hypothetical protein
LGVQFSLFGAAVAEPALDDLDGVLLAGGHWVRSGTLARLSIVVGAPWRADALVAAFLARGVAEPVAPVVAAEGGWGVRTAFAVELSDHAARWTRGANEGVPTGLTLAPGGLRLWCVAAGRADEGGYLLGTDEPDDPAHRAAGAQLSRLGLAGVSVTSRGGGPGWRVTSARRLRRLAEVVGEPPDGAGSDWPT